MSYHDKDKRSHTAHTHTRLGCFNHSCQLWALLSRASFASCQLGILLTSCLMNFERWFIRETSLACHSPSTSLLRCTAAWLGDIAVWLTTHLTNVRKKKRLTNKDFLVAKRKVFIFLFATKKCIGNRYMRINPVCGGINHLFQFMSALSSCSSCQLRQRLIPWALLVLHVCCVQAFNNRNYSKKFC